MCNTSIFLLTVQHNMQHFSMTLVAVYFTYKQPHETHDLLPIKFYTYVYHFPGHSNTLVYFNAPIRMSNHGIVSLECNWN